MGFVDRAARVKDLDLPRTRNWNAPALDTYARACLLRSDARLGDVISHSRGCLSYLATPYSKLARDDDGAFSSAGSLECAARAARWARLLALEGITAVSPIIQAVEMVHVDVIDPQLDPLDERFWEGWCRRCSTHVAASLSRPFRAGRKARASGSRFARRSVRSGLCS